MFTNARTFHDFYQLGNEHKGFNLMLKSIDVLNIE